MDFMVQQAYERLFLIDGMALAYRAYFAFITRPLINSKGINTSAMFGFTNSLMKLLDDECPDHIAVVFDTKEPTFRHRRYAQYKATRQKMPEEMASQMETLKEIIHGFSIPIVEIPGYEADDVIGTLAKRAEEKNIETFMVTGDKDYMQLISPMIKMYKPGTKSNEVEIIDESEVRAHFGVSPKQVVDILALMGDKSDNVPGVPGIGEKTAIELIKEFGSLENLYENLSAVQRPSLREKLKEHRELAFLSRELVTIDTRVPLSIDLRELKALEPNREVLHELFKELEFKTLLRRISSPKTEPSFDVEALESIENIATRQHAYHIITNRAELQDVVETVRDRSIVVIDTETTSRNAMDAELVGISLAFDPGTAYFIPIHPSGHDSATEKERPDLFSSESAASGAVKEHRGLSLEEVRADLAELLQSEMPRKGGQNIKYDMLVLRSHGIEIGGIPFDTMVASYILRPDGQHGLDALAQEYLNYKTISYKDLTGKGKNQQHILDVPVEKLAEYSAEDADLTLQLVHKLSSELKRSGMLELCERVEFPLITVLADMEYTGVALDIDFLKGMSRELERQIQGLVLEIHRLAGASFNINSTQQLGEILFEKLKLPVVRRTKTGFSTDISVLEALRHEHPIIEKLLEYRQLSKLKSTYVDALPKLVNPRTGRVHTSFNQTITATGRLSSSDPNLQNIPARSDTGREIRKAFIAGNEGWGILAADYSQIELRIMAHISGDDGLKQAFLNGEDIHASTASRIFGIPQSEVTRDMRRKAKEVNFGIMYGIGPYGLASRLDVSQAEARNIITTYFAQYPKVNEYIFNTIAKARKEGYVSTLLGRRRYLPEITSRNQTVRQNAERQAINMPIQGTAADMIKLAMINIHRAFRERKLAAKMILQVHDELVFEVPEKEVDVVSEIVRKEMKNALPLDVPVEVDIGFGANWLEAH